MPRRVRVKCSTRPTCEIKGHKTEDGQKFSDHRALDIGSWDDPDVRRGECQVSCVTLCTLDLETESIETILNFGPISLWKIETRLLGFCRP